MDSLKRDRYYYVLSGAAPDIQRLQRSHSLPPTRVISCEGEWFLDSDRLQSGEDFEAARELLTNLMRSVKACGGKLDQISIGGHTFIDKLGQATKSAGGVAQIGGRGHVTATLTVVRDGKVLQPEPSLESRLVECLPKLPSEARDLLDYCDIDNQSWGDLTVILEILKKAKFVTGKEPNLDLVRRTANSWVGSKGMGRHYGTEHQPPPNPVSLQDARVTMQDYVRRYFEAVCPK